MVVNLQRTLKNRILIVLLVVIGAVSLVCGAYFTWLMTPPEFPETAADGVALIGSRRFERMPEYRKAEYLERTTQLMRDLEPQDRQALRSELKPNDVRQFFQQMMMQRALKFSNADPQQRNRMLDEAIDQWGRRGGRRRSRPDDGNEQERDQRQGAFRNRMQEYIQEGNPQTGALIGEYFRAIRQRREERGIEEPGN